MFKVLFNSKTELDHVIDDGPIHTYIRVLEPSDYPVLLTAIWSLDAQPRCLVIKERSIELPSTFKLLRMVHCKNMSLIQIRNRLEGISREEQIALIACETKFSDIKQFAIQMRDKKLPL